MKSIPLNGLNPLNPAHYLAALGTLALASRWCDELNAPDNITLEWPPAPEPETGALPFRPMLRVPGWSTKAVRELFRFAGKPSPCWPGSETGLKDISEGGSGLLEGQFDRVRKAMASVGSNNVPALIAVVTEQSSDIVRKKAKEYGLDIESLPTGRATDAEVQTALNALLARRRNSSPVIVFGKASVIGKVEKTISEVEELKGIRTVRIEPLGTGPLLHELALKALNSTPALSAEARRLTWLTSGRLAKNNNAETTAWLLGKKAGLLRPLRDTIWQARPTERFRRFRRFRKVLGGPGWPYSTNGPMLGLDSDTSTDGARSIRNTDGASPPQCLEALRLIGEGLPLFTAGAGGQVAVISRAAALTALPALANEDQNAEAFLYPLWSPPLTLPEVRLVLHYPWNQLIRSPVRLRTIGVWALLAAPCQHKGGRGDPTERQLGRAIRVV